MNNIPELYSFSVHAVIFNKEGQVLQLKSSYIENQWALPGGCVEKGETILETLRRECREELGINVKVEGLTGIYYHSKYNSQVCIFRCSIPENNIVSLSNEHTDYKYFDVSDITEIQRIRVEDAKKYNAEIGYRSF